MTSEAELLGLAVLGLSGIASGAAIVALGRARVSSACLVLGGAAILAGTLLSRTDQTSLDQLLWTAGGALFLPLALSTYPRLERHPVDIAALATMAVAGLVGVVAYRRVGSLDQPGVLEAVIIALAVVGFLHTWWRLERSQGDDRRALAWMALTFSAGAVTLFFVAFLNDGVDWGRGAEIAVGVCYGLFGLVGPAMYVGLRRPEIVDVRGLVVRAAVLLTAILVYMSLYATAQGLIEVLTDRAPSVGTMGFVAAVAAITFHPLQVTMRGVVDQLLFGTRPDPLGAAGHVAGKIGDDPELALQAIRDALVLPYAQLRLDGKAVASSGDAVAHTRTVPLALGEGRSGELVVGLRPGDLGLSASDAHVLNLATPLLAQTMRARALAEDLQESREQTIAALEEERRRLRRDLHDGLGPRLSGIAFTSDAARNTMRDDPEAAEGLLRSLRAETVAAIHEIRQLVYAMRPPALDELGLVPAVRQATSMLRTPDGRPMQVDIDAGDLPPLTAAVEVAAYRIVVEALTNAARHSGQVVAEARLRVLDGSLAVDVADRGTSDQAWTTGVGLSSMRERAAELGGTLTVEQSADGGRVRAVLPLGDAS